MKHLNITTNTKIKGVGHPAWRKLPLWSQSCHMVSHLVPSSSNPFQLPLCTQFHSWHFWTIWFGKISLPKCYIRFSHNCPEFSEQIVNPGSKKKEERGKIENPSSLALSLSLRRPFALPAVLFASVANLSNPSKTINAERRTKWNPGPLWNNVKHLVPIRIHFMNLNTSWNPCTLI